MHNSITDPKKFPTQQQLELYALLMVKMGINLQKGMRVVLQAPTFAWDFVRLLTETCYKEGALRVYHEFTDDVLTGIQLRYGGLEAAEYPGYEMDFFLDKFRDNGAYIRLYSPIPHALDDVPQNVVDAYTVSKTIARKEMQRIVGDFASPWLIAVYPNLPWARQVYPDLNDEAALAKLWQDLFDFTFVTGGRPLEDLERLILESHDRVEKLNAFAFEKLVYSSPTADLTIQLPKGHVWNGGAEMTAGGVRCMANIPTAEVYTSPAKYGVNGWVKNTKPLVNDGILIDDFRLTFKDGKVVDWNCGKGEGQLRAILTADEGSSYLGEVALVPVDSPLAKAGAVYYNTLLDENASCHLALGDSFALSLSADADPQERAKLNHSDKHVDFMIGSAELDIRGVCADGKEVQIFHKGLWAF